VITLMVGMISTFKSPKRGKVDLSVKVDEFKIEDRIDKLAYIVNVLGILMFQGARSIILGEIPTEIKVMGVKRLVDVFGQGDEIEFYGEIERDRERLEVEVLGLNNELGKYTKSFKVVGFLVSVSQELDKELLWQTTVKVYSFNNIPIYKIDVKRGFAWIS